MVIIQNLFSAMAEIIHLAITLYIYVIIARVVISWINVNPYNSIVRFIYMITEPVLLRIRRLIPNLGGLDISPMILIFILIFLDRFIVSTLR
jgi:YggT family protein